MTVFDIKIISDTVCPWCYVGAKRLDRAIASHRATHGSDTFRITWSPFYLDPTAPTEGVSKAERYAQRFGAERVAMMQQRLGAIGRAEGIEFAFGGRTGNTRDSHRLVQLGREKGGEEGQGRVVRELFASYFEKEGDITSKEMLVSAGVKAGLGEGEAREWLEGDKGGKVVDKEVKVNSMETSGVPHFIVQGEYEVNGAQDPEAFLSIFDKIKKRGE